MAALADAQKYHGGYTLIDTDDANHPEAFEVNLMGVGVIMTEPPSEQVLGILQFFDESGDLGTLVGNGNGKSANGRRNALRNMIVAAGDLIDDGLIGNACIQLQDALNRTDGETPPPDFVAGEAAPMLASLIEDLRATLECG